MNNVLNLNLSLIIIFVLCISSVFSYAIHEEEINHIERRGTNEKVFPTQNYFMAYKTSMMYRREDLSRCRFNVIMRSIICDNNSAKFYMSYKLDYNVNCSYGNYELKNVRITQGQNETFEIGQFAMISEDYHVYNTIELTFQSNCVIRATYDMAKPTITNF
jgi:hypothetical protein